MKRKNWKKPMVYVSPFYWAVTNWGIFQGRLFHTRRAAQGYAEKRATEENFPDWQDVYEIRKVTLKPEASR